MIQTAASPITDEFFIVEGSAKDMPEHLGTNCLFVWLFAKGGGMKCWQYCVLWGNVFRERKLILAFGVNGLLPKGGASFWGEIKHRAREQRVG